MVPGISPVESILPVLRVFLTVEYVGFGEFELGMLKL
jgi:hypothetical protein